MKYSEIQHKKNKKRNLYIIISVLIYFSYRFMFCYDITYPLYIQSDHFLDYYALFKPLIVNPFKLRLLHEQLKEYSDFDKQKLKFDSQYHDYLKSECKIAQLALKNGFEIEGIEEKDDEIKGSGNSVDFGARMLDTRVGRFLSMNPLASKAGDYTSYRFGFNNPIKNIDVGGLYETDGYYWTTRLVGTLLKLTDRQMVAYYSELPDHIYDEVSGNAIITVTWTNPFLQMSIHALNGENSNETRARFRYNLSMARNSYGRGIAAHGLMDSYAHTRIDDPTVMHSSPFGHMFEGSEKSPDFIRLRPDLYVEGVKDLVNTLQEAGYGREKKMRIDMFTFEYVSQAGLTTEQNSKR